MAQGNKEIKYLTAPKIVKGKRNIAALRKTESGISIIRKRVPHEVCE
jgi:hypothetical protein